MTVLWKRRSGKIVAEVRTFKSEDGRLWFEARVERDSDGSSKTFLSLEAAKRQAIRELLRAKRLGDDWPMKNQKTIGD